MKKKGPILSALLRIRSVLRRLFPPVTVFLKTLALVYSSRSMLRKLGYIESVKSKKPCRKDGSPIPWMNYHVIQFLEERLTKDLSLFEYGSGNSTFFYASLVRNVTSIELDEQWYAYVQQKAPSNVRLILFEIDSQESYCEIARQQDQKFDVIVVDAAERVDCLKQAPAALTDTGVIILDDTGDSNHAEGIDFLIGHGFRKLDFEGLKANSIRAYRTSVFYRAENCLGI
jgi:hypothetical protein